jgi:hypothetical protein
MNSTLNNPTPQFGTAEYVGTAGGDHCQFCHQPIGLTYYRANAAMACPGCAESVRGELANDTHAAFLRAIVFGVGAAILGLILYATFAIVTGIVIGYASLAVGWLVGKAMVKGSNGVGGRRYQVVAILLTYAAVAMAAIPVMIDYARKHPHELQTRRKAAANSDDLDGSATRQPPKAESAQSGGFGLALAQLALWGLASPFLELFGDPLGGLIGLVILSVGMRFAWRFTAGKPIEIFGPFENSPQPTG